MGKFWGCALALVALSGAFTGSAGSQGARTVNVYNWSDYIDPKVIEEFTKETGIEVKYDTFDSNDMLETKLLAGSTGYDIVVPTAYFLERQIKAGIFQKLDKAKLQEHRQRLGRRSPGGSRATIPATSTPSTTCGARPASAINVKKARDILGADGRIDSWDIVFKPEMLAKFKDCGVHVLDAADDVFAAALHYLKLDPNTKSAGGPRQGRGPPDEDPPLGAQIPLLGIPQRARHRAKSAWCVGYSGDIKQAQKRAAEAKNGVEIGYAIPKRGRADCGSTIWRSRRTPGTSPRRTSSSTICCAPMWRRMQHQLRVVCERQPGEPRSRSTRRSSTTRRVYPDDATMKTLYTITAHDQKTQRILNRLWTG